MISLGYLTTRHSVRNYRSKLLTARDWMDSLLWRLWFEVMVPPWFVQRPGWIYSPGSLLASNGLQDSTAKPWLARCITLVSTLSLVETCPNISSHRFPSIPVFRFPQFNNIPIILAYSNDLIFI